MEFSATTAELRHAVTEAGRAVRPSPPIAALSGVLLEKAGRTLTVTGSDLERTITTNITVDGDDTDERFVLPASMFREILASLDGESVTLSSEGDVPSEIKVTSSAAEFNVRTLARENYPKIEPLTTKPVILDAPALFSGVRQVLHAASKDPTRPLLAGVLIESTDDGVRVVSTDSFRLAVRDIAGVSAIAPGSVVVPMEALSSASKMFASSDKVEVRIDENSLSVTGDNGSLTTRLLIGEFPAYQKLIPSAAAPIIVRADAAALVAALNRATIAARLSGAAMVARLNIGSDPNQVVISAQSANGDASSEALDIEHEGDPILIATNPTFLVEAINAVGGDTVRIEITSELKPMIVRQDGDDSALVMVMPTRVTN